MQKIPVSLIAPLMGAQSVLRSAAYRLFSARRPDAPFRPVLRDALCFDPRRSANARALGWRPTNDRAALLDAPETKLVDFFDSFFVADDVAEILDAGKHLCVAAPRFGFRGRLAEHREAVWIAAGRPNLLSAVRFEPRSWPGVVCARELVAKNGREWGALREARLYTFREYAADWRESFRYRVGPDDGAAAVLLPALFDALYFVAGVRPAELCAAQTPTGRVCARSPKTRWRGKTYRTLADDATRVVFSTKNGALGSVDVSRTTRGRRRNVGFELVFDGATARFSFDSPNALFVCDEANGWREIRTDNPASAPVRTGELWRRTPFLPRGAYGDVLRRTPLPVDDVCEVLRAVAALEGGERRESAAPVATFADAYEVARTLEAVRTSVAERRWVDLDEIR